MKTKPITKNKTAPQPNITKAAPKKEVAPQKAAVQKKVEAVTTTKIPDPEENFKKPVVDGEVTVHGDLTVFRNGNRFIVTQRLSSGGYKQYLSDTNPLERD